MKTPVTHLAHQRNPKMTDHELMAAKYAGSAFAILYKLPKRSGVPTDNEVAEEIQKQKTRAAEEEQRRKIKEKNAAYYAKMKKEVK